MPMKARMTAKDWLNTLDLMQLEKVCSLKDNPTFIEFLARSDMGPVESAHYALACISAGVPVEYTDKPETLHYLTVAIANYLKGNG